VPNLPPVVIMGVTGSGKTTVGRLLAQRLWVPYAEADDFHPPANVAKMSRGMPLDDADRDPWLAAIAGRIAASSADGGVVISCSALKRRYRDRLRAADPRIWFLHLSTDPPVIAERVAGRIGHFMPATLVESQFHALEPLGPDERGLVVDASRTPEQIVATVLEAFPGSGADRPAAPVEGLPGTRGV
jgi:gluconokinase